MSKENVNNSIIDKIITIMKPGYICNHCLGRQFAQILTGMTNEERGKIIRSFAAMLYDANEIDVHPSNFYNLKLRNKLPGKKEKCYMCGDIFNSLEKVFKKIEKKLKGIEFDSMLMGTRLSSELLEKEETLWSKIGIEYCEPLKAELNREIGKLIEKKLRKKVDFKNPQVSILYDIGKNKIEISIKPIYIYGEYQKLKRGIPQTKWPSGKYKNSIEQIVAKPIMKLTKGSGHKFHGAGREDIDALCLGWRPFVIEISNPKVRKFNLNKIKEEINRDKRINVRKLRWSNLKEVIKIKESRYRKEYTCKVVCEKPIKKKDLTKLKLLITTIKQRTPTRVLHRRSDLLRKRNIYDIKSKFLSSKKFELRVFTEAGTYIKELVSGDNKRTKPSVSSILNNECVCKDLIVTKIEKKGK